MNRLQLVQRLQLEAGASGSLSTTLSQTGELGRLVTWVDQAWEDIQRMNDQWQWMRKTFTFTTVQGQQDYPPASAPLSLTDFADWVSTTFRIYQSTVDNEEILSFKPYDIFRDTYLYGTTRNTQGHPIAITITPTKSLALGLIPNANDYTVTGDYHAAPSVMAADTDTPEMPERFHIMIVWKALMYYGGYESAQDAYSRGQENMRILKDELMIHQAPTKYMDRSFL